MIREYTTALSNQQALSVADTGNADKKIKQTQSFKKNMMQHSNMTTSGGSLIYDP